MYVLWFSLCPGIVSLGGFPDHFFASPMASFFTFRLIALLTFPY
jgi:hypothetical protein